MKISATVLFIIAMPFLFSGSVSSPENITNLITALNQKTDECVLLHKENAELKLKVEALSETISDEQIAAIPAVYFAKVGYFEKENPFPRDPAYMRRIWSYCKKYRYLLTPEAEASAKEAKIIPEYFVFVWPGKESHYNPTLTSKNFDDKGRVISYDLNLSQINSGSRKDQKTGLEYPTMEFWNHYYNHLPDELKRRRGDPTKDPEIGIAILYVWINHRVEGRFPWAFLNDWTWHLYWQCKQVEAG